MNIGWQISPRFDVSVSGKFVSKRYDVGGYQKPDVMLEDYFLVGAHANFTANNHIKFFADGQNITGKKFFDIRGYNAIPALFMGGVTVNW